MRYNACHCKVGWASEGHIPVQSSWKPVLQPAGIVLNVERVVATLTKAVSLDRKG